MKILFFSDIHGSLPAMESIMDLIQQENPSLVVFCGDLLYHGPRNPIPDGYDPAAVASLLNREKGRVLSCRGNCDSEVDQMLLEFPILADYSLFWEHGFSWMVTHGHKYNPQKFPPLGSHGVLVYGHTHIPEIRVEGETVFFNPGSVTFPKGVFVPSYGKWDGNLLQILSLQGELLMEKKL